MLKKFFKKKVAHKQHKCAKPGQASAVHQAASRQYTNYVGLDENGHQLDKSREIALVHLLRLLGALVRSDEVDVREGIESKESEALLKLFEQLRLQLQYSRCCKRRGYVNFFFKIFYLIKFQSLSPKKKKKKDTN